VRKEGRDVLALSNGSGCPTAVVVGAPSTVRRFSDNVLICSSRFGIQIVSKCMACQIERKWEDDDDFPIVITRRNYDRVVATLRIPKEIGAARDWDRLAVAGKVGRRAVELQVPVKVGVRNATT
jgi:hypothetical protein